MAASISSLNTSKCTWCIGVLIQAENKTCRGPYLSVQSIPGHWSAVHKPWTFFIYCLILHTDIMYYMQYVALISRPSVLASSVILRIKVIQATGPYYILIHVHSMFMCIVNVKVPSSLIKHVKFVIKMREL